QELPLSFAQERLWFLEQLGTGDGTYVIRGALRLDGALDRAVLEASFDALVRRHEALRTRIGTVGGRGIQVIDAAGDFGLEVMDLGGVSEPMREAEVLRLAMAEASWPFDLTAGPLFRVKLLRLAAERHVLIVTMHHLVSDGWSMGVLAREIGTLY